MTIWLFFGVLAVVAIVAVIWCALVLAGRSDDLAEELQRAIYGEGDDDGATTPDPR